MTLSKIINTAFIFCTALLIWSCEDNVSKIGSELVGSEVVISVDTVKAQLNCQTMLVNEFDGRTQSKLLGRINVPEYGKLDCSFVSQLMSSAKLNIPDSITVNDVDSMRVLMTVPRGSLTGDSLAPQQLKVYALTKKLPLNITNDFNTSGYYDASNPLGVKSYTLSRLALSDSLFKEQSIIKIPVQLGRDIAVKYFNMYRNPAEAGIFEWPNTFANEFPGVYVEQNFGNGCIGLINSLGMFLYWHYPTRVYQKKETSSSDSESGEGEEYEYVTKIVRDSVCLFSSEPEVISSNIIDYQVSDNLKNLVSEGSSVITTPGGYEVKFRFPIEKVLEKYNSSTSKLTVVSRLSMEIPANVVENDYGIGVVPNLLMVKTDKRKEFFENNLIPDNETSFYATYDNDKGLYSFNGMRSYILGLIEKQRNGETIAEADLDFTLVPVIVDTEDVETYTQVVTYVTKCAPYIGRPTMTLLDTDNSIVIFSFSRQEIQ